MVAQCVHVRIDCRVRTHGSVWRNIHDVRQWRPLLNACGGQHVGDACMDTVVKSMEEAKARANKRAWSGINIFPILSDAREWIDRALTLVRLRRRGGRRSHLFRCVLAFIMWIGPAMPHAASHACSRPACVRICSMILLISYTTCTSAALFWSVRSSTYLPAEIWLGSVYRWSENFPSGLSTEKAKLAIGLIFFCKHMDRGRLVKK